MIKASELRKGNLLQHQHGSFLEVRVITTPESIKSEQEIFSCVNGFSVHELEPVTITEERLEKFGFVGFDGPKFPHTENHQFNHTRYRKTTSQDELVLTEIEGIYILEGTENCASYIHQLQNICADKSGEELDIKSVTEKESIYY